MIIRHASGLLPRYQWSKIAPRAVYIGDVAVTPRSRLRVKLLVFPTSADLAEFWERFMPPYSTFKLGQNCRGVVHPLAVERWSTSNPKRRWREVDPRYFAVMGLVQGHLRMEIITHESVHAAYAYSERVPGHFWPDNENPQERLCYPAGRIAAAVNRALHDADLYS